MATPTFQEVLQSLLEKENTLINLEMNIAGLDISVADLKAKMQKVHKAAKSTEDEKKEAQTAYMEEQEKLKVVLEQQST